FFSLILTSPPTSTLFPYTTLFRSPHSGGWLLRNAGQRPHPGVPRCRRLYLWRGDGVARVARRSPTDAPLTTAIPGCRRSVSAAEDRKSTRLNSSHLVISYAVFCLK